MADTARQQDESTVGVTVDGVEVRAEKGEWVIAAAERHGVYIPRFCYHPRMRPVGMCRMCLVEVDTGRGPALQTACTIPVADGMTVVTDSERVKKAQDGVLEFLLINHPLDCPVCDKGGECPLQDQTLAFGPGETRFVEEKRHWEKPISLSPLVHMDRERCVLCDRCTRFSDEVAGDPLISFMGRGNETQVNTYPDDPFSSYFSGNTVQICPVGALLAVPYRFRARPWDLDQVESTCTTCAVGCRTAVQSSSNRLVRYLGVDVDPVNWGWLCDRGRFDFEAVNSDDRLAAPMARSAGGGHVDTTWSAALRVAADGIRSAVDAGGPGAVAVIGGARLTNEDAYAWAKLAKGVIGTDNVDAQLGDGLPAEAVLGLPRATIDQVCAARTIVVLGPDVKEELPVLYLRLRHAVVRDGARLVEISPAATGLTPHAEVSLRYRPGEAHELMRLLLSGESGNGDDASIEQARHLLAEGSVACVLGRPSVAESADGIVEAAAMLLDFPEVAFLSALRRGNVHGALDMGLAPGVLPGRVSLDDGADHLRPAWANLPSSRGLDTAGILRAAAEGRVRSLVLLGADPAADFPDADLARRALERVEHVVAVDCFMTESARHAHVVLPAAGYAEKSGTTTNIEGRISRLTQKVTPPGTARPDWMIAVELAHRLGHDLGFESLQDVWEEIGALAPSHQGVTLDLLHSARGLDGIVVPLDGPPPPVVPTRPAETETPGQVAADTQGGHGGVEQSVGGSRHAPVAAPEGGGGATAPEDQAAAAGAAGDTPAEGDDADAAEASARASEAASEQADDAGDVVEGDGAGRTPSARHRDDVRPPLLRFSPSGAPTPPRADSYSLRLVSGRKLYDRATLVQRSPSLAALAPGATARLHPADLDRLGLGTGATVRVSSPRGAHVVEAVADVGVAKGTVVVWFNQPGLSAAELIVGDAPVTDIRVETVRAGEG